MHLSRIGGRRLLLVGLATVIGLLLVLSADRAHAEGGGPALVADDDRVFTGTCSCPLCTGQVSAPGSTASSTWHLSGDPAGSLVGDEPFPLAIEYFTTGSPPVSWANSAAPVEICTHQAGRPSTVSAELFRNTVRDAAQVWNDVGAAIGYRYAGDCNAGNVRAFRNGANEIAFDMNNEVESPTAALTHGAWTANRQFIEIDVLLHPELDVAEPCLFSVIVHELGHGLGFGHSSSPGHLMYPTFDGQQVSTCITAPTSEEVDILVDLYGANELPELIAPTNATIFAGVVSSLSVSGTDPDGGTLTYLWTQVEGPQIAFSPGGNSISFVAPDAEGAVLSFRVDAYDRYLARTSTTLTATIQPRPPPGSFTGELPVTGGFGLIVWQGGLIDSLIFGGAEQGCRMISVWSSVNGKLIGYTPGAPAFVNQNWVNAFPGTLPDGLPLLAVCARR